MVGAAVNITDILCTTVDGDGACLACRQVSSAVDLVDSLSATAGMVNCDAGSAADGSRCVASRKHTADGAAMNSHAGAISNVGCCHLAIAAAKHVADSSAVDGDVGGRDVGSVAAAVHARGDLGIAFLYHVDHRGTADVTGVAAAEDRTRNGHLMPIHIIADGHGGISRHLAFGMVACVALAAAIDVAANGAVEDVHCQAFAAGYRVLRQVTAAEHFANIPVRGASSGVVFFNIDLDTS